MTTIQQLEEAIRERIIKENKFKDSIVSNINDILSKLPICDSLNSTTEVSNTVNLSKEKLESILQKIGDFSSINEKAANDIIAKLNFKNVRNNRTSRSSSLGDINKFMLEHPEQPLDSKDSFNLSQENFAKLQKYYPEKNEKKETEEKEEEQYHFGGKRTKSRRR